jgi:hypothetical protein
MAKPKSRLTGELGKPLEPLPIKRLLADSSLIPAEAEKRHELNYKKLSALRDSYGIESNEIEWYELALALAKEFDPAFRVKKMEGRPKAWTLFFSVALYVDIEKIKRRYRIKSVPVAAAQLLKDQPLWQLFLDLRSTERKAHVSADPVEAIRKRFLFKEYSPLKKLTWKAYRTLDEDEFAGEWDKNVARELKKAIQH